MTVGPSAQIQKYVTRPRPKTQGLVVGLQVVGLQVVGLQVVGLQEQVYATIHMQLHC